VRPLVVAIPRFIQIRMPLPPLKPMAQSRCGAVRILEVQMPKVSLKYYNQLILKNFKLILVYI
jgi:hypothetical protein